MAENTTLARPYARALFAHAEKEGTVDEWNRRLAVFGRAAGLPAVSAVLRSPRWAAGEKIDWLCEVSGVKSEAPVRNFLRLLVENGKLPLLADIARLFSALVDGRRQTERIDVALARETSEAALKNLTAALGKKFGRKLSVNTKVDPSLLGGAVVRVGDTVIDGSLRGRLRHFAGEITDSSFHSR